MKFLGLPTSTSHYQSVFQGYKNYTDLMHSKEGKVFFVRETFPCECCLKELRKVTGGPSPRSLAI